MRAAYITEPGPASSIIVGDLPEPKAAPDEVLVRVKMAAVNHVDTFIRSGQFPTKLPSPFIIGRDLVGQVETAAHGFREGQWVWCNSLGTDGLQGSFAQFVAVPQNRLYHMPLDGDPQTVAATLHAGLTASIGLIDKAAVRPKDTVFICGASGPVGMMAVQVAHSWGARVIATAGTPKKASWLRQLGVQKVINYHQESTFEVLRKAAPDGIDVFWEATAQVDLEATLPLMAQHGRIVILSGRNNPPLPIWQFYTRNCSIHGFVVTGTPVAELATHASRINQWLVQGMGVKIDRILPLEKAAQAHRAMEEESLFGKIVIEV